VTAGLRRLAALPLDPIGFAPFGTVVAASGGLAAHGGRPINAGSSMRFDLSDDLCVTAQAGRPVLAVFRAQARRFPFRATELERHRLGSQLFVPLAGVRSVILVAPAGEAPDPDRLVAFRCDGRQGVLLAPGTWHHPLLALDDGDFVVVERAGAQIDCDVALLPVPVEVVP
jgi:ureidoglycolate lyase